MVDFQYCTTVSVTFSTSGHERYYDEKSTIVNRTASFGEGSFLSWDDCKEVVKLKTITYVSKIDFFSN